MEIIDHNFQAAGCCAA